MNSKEIDISLLKEIVNPLDKLSTEISILNYNNVA